MFLTITAAGANAAGFSFMDSVKEFFGIAPTQIAAPVTQTAEPYNAPAMEPMMPPSTVFSDDFSTNTNTFYTNSGAIGSSAWSVLVSGNDWGARRSNTSPNQLELTNDATPTNNVVGWCLASTASSSFSSPYNTILGSNPGLVTWTFNMRQIRTDPAGFALGNYGVAFIVAGTSNTDITNGSGYAVVLGQSGTTDSIRLARYSSGLSGTLTDIIVSNTSGLTDFGSGYVSVKVTYLPSSNTWELFLRNDGASAFTDPTTGTLTSQGTVTDSTSTGTSLPLMGAYWGGSTGVSQTAFFDNTTVTVDQPSQFLLSVALAGSGSGQVTSNPAGITCGVDCTEVYSSGTNVQLTATGFVGSTFAGWSGDCAGQPAVCSVTMDQARSATATFNLAATATNTPTPITQYQLSVSRDGTGSGSVTSAPAGITCGADCTELYDSGTVVTLTAAPDPVSTFAGWTGEPCAGLPENCDVTMTQARSVTATFHHMHQIAVSRDGTGGGTVTSQPAGIDCGTTCSSSFVEGTMVTLTAVPDASSQLGDWGGDCAGQPPAACTVSALVPRTILKTFFLDTTAPTVTIFSTDPNPTTSGTTLTWHADEAGTFEVRVGGTGCTSGHVGHTGDYITVSNPVDTIILPSELLRGTNTIRVCVRDAAGNTGEASTTVQMQSCTAPDNGTGTIDLPAQCRYLGGPMPIITPPPPGQPTMGVGSLDSFTDVVSTPGGSLGGESTTAASTVRLAFRPTAAAAGRAITMPSCPVTFDSAPRTPGSPVQSFATEMISMQCQMPPGDPDFDLLRIRAGSSFGLPSPGHTTLRCASGSCSVDSFFDIDYTIDYVGRAGGPFSGMSGSTTGTIRMSQVSGPPPPSSCTAPDSGTGTVEYPPDCPMEGWPVTMLNGLPPGVAVTGDLSLSNPSSVSSSPGGSLGGTQHTFVWSSSLSLAGTGDPDFDLLRVIPMSNCPVVIDTAPRSPGSPVQSFDTEMISMECQAIGDPDFDLLRIRAGSSFGLPSPGHTTLIRESPTLFAVDSFFDVFYSVEFQGRPGGRFGGMSGSTTGTIRMQMGIPGDRSITVIKLNDTTGSPLPGWTMNLYGGPGCTGPVLDTQVTNADGLADFVGLTNADYSVQEVMQGGWTPAGPVCQDITLSGPGGGGGGGCGGGSCTSGAHMKLEIQGLPPMVITGNGQTTVQRGPTCPGCGPGGRDYFDTEMLSMDLQGSSSVLGPFMIRESPTRASTGRTTQQTPGVDFPADSFFDVFFEIQSAAGLYHFGNNPDNICAVTSGYPPTNSPYTSMGSHALFDAANQPVGFVHDLLHVTLLPGEILIVFRNQPPPATPTNTATPTPTPINHSITVLKVNDTTGLPMSGWTMNLYSGPGCTGTLLDTQATDNDGIVDFLNLAAGSYSVGEVNQPGWTPMSGVCQDVSLVGRPGGHAPPMDYGSSGNENWNFGGQLHVRNIGSSGQDGVSIDLRGQGSWHRSEPCAGCLPGGGDYYDTEMLSMNLQGTSPVGPFMIRESPTRASTGRVSQQTPGVDFPADSFFDVFLEIDVGGSTFHATQPYTATGILSDGTSRNDSHSTGCTEIPLFDSTGQPAGSMSCLVFVPLFADETFIVFRNRPPAPTATATATYTPTPPQRSITVIKLNDTTGTPLPGWTMNLYGGPGCTGSILDTQVTNADGLADFTGLSNGDYSVAEVVQGGWTPITPVCQDVSLSGGGGGGGGSCGSGGAGDCTSDSGVHMKLEIQGMPMQHVTASGPTTVHRSSTCPGCGQGGRDYFDTEMLSMDLQGSSPVLGPFMIRESPTRASTGRTTQQTPGVDFPADSFFDVFFEIQSAAGLYHFGNNPDNICAVVSGDPPTNSPYTSMGSHALFDATNQPVGFVHDLLHVTLLPGEILIVFRNQPPPPTATNTATSTPTPSSDFCSSLIAAGQPGSCSTGGDASSSDTTVTQVTIPSGAAPSSFTLSITETNSPSPPSGFRACGQLVDIDAQGVTLTSPATITFECDASATGGGPIEGATLFRDGLRVPDCTGSNDPCVSSRSLQVDGDLLITCDTSHFSPWVVAINDSSISGTVTYGNPVTGPNPRGVPSVQLSGVGSPAVTDTTVAAGTYSLTGFGLGSYTITPSKSGGVNGAVTSFDAGRIAQYITGNTSFTSAQVTVADVSGAGGLSSFDAALIARYAAALGPPNGNTGTWLFNPASNLHPSITSNVTGEDYAALLMGDVSGNWGDPSPFRPVIGGNGPERNAAVNAPTLVTPADNEVVIPVAVLGVANKDVISYEFDLRYDPLVIQPQKNPVDVAETVSSGLSTVVNAEIPGLLRVVAYGPMPIDGNGLLLNLRFTAVGAPGTVSTLTWERFMLNEGTPRITVADGQVELVRALPNQAEISGRLLTSFGVGIPNSRVTLTDTAGRSRSILSNGFGIYRFGDLQVGQTYTIRVNARDHRFAPATISITDQIVNVDMIAEQ